jgi:tagatose 6-phosphate kinase
MILTVTLNLAVDVTYHLERIRWRETSRVEDVARRAGGKGVNVARVLHALGHEAVVTGLAGGATGAAARAELETAGISDRTVSIAGTSRTTLIVVEADGGATGFSERGPPVSEPEWRRMLQRFGSLLAEAEAVALAGSLPPGVPSDAYAQLIGLTAAADVPVLLDAEGDALALGVAARPTMVKINADELAGLGSGPDVLGGATALQAAGAQAVVVSEGERGLLAVTPEGRWRAAPPQKLLGNPTGAGDAVSAALLEGAWHGRSWPERLSDAVALSAAAVRAPLAGSFDDDVYRSLRGVPVTDLGR